MERGIQHGVVVKIALAVLRRKHGVLVFPLLVRVVLLILYIRIAEICGELVEFARRVVHSGNGGGRRTVLCLVYGFLERLVYRIEIGALVHYVVIAYRAALSREYASAHEHRAYDQSHDYDDGDHGHHNG